LLTHKNHCLKGALKVKTLALQGLHFSYVKHASSLISSQENGLSSIPSLEKNCMKQNISKVISPCFNVVFNIRFIVLWFCAWRAYACNMFI